MKRIGMPAVVAAIIGPIQSVSGWAICGALFAGYDPVVQTISELASAESPVRYIQSAFFILGGTLTLLAAIYARTLAMPGRVALFVSAICTYGLTIFPTTFGNDAPLTPVSLAHRVFAIASFALSAGWLLLAMRKRKDAPWIIRPTAAILQTLFQATIAIIFLVIWTDPTNPTIGVWERVVATAQSLQVSVVVLVIWWGQRAKPAVSKSAA